VSKVSYSIAEINRSINIEHLYIFFSTSLTVSLLAGFVQPTTSHKLEDEVSTFFKEQLQYEVTEFHVAQ